MKTRELRELTTEKLNDRLKKLRSELSEVEFDIRLGQEKDYASRSKKRKEIAKILTILKEGSNDEDKKETSKSEDKRTNKKTKKKTTKKSGSKKKKTTKKKSKSKSKK